MSPRWLLDLGMLGLVKPRARPRNGRAVRAGENDLEQLQRSGAERGQRSCQVQTPGADKSRVVHRFHLALGFFKALEPMLKRLSVVPAQILNVLNTEIHRLQNSERLFQRGHERPREDALADPAAQRRRFRSSDEVQQASAGIADGPLKKSGEIQCV